MRTILAVVVFFVALSMSRVPASAADGPRRARGPLVHLVSFKFKEEATAEQVRRVEEAFAALPKKIRQIATYEAGTNVSPEHLNKGFTHAFLLTFATAKDRDEYLVHPDHKAFAGLIGPAIADVFVIDFWTPPPAGEAAR